MEIFKIAVIAIIIVILALLMKSTKPEYGLLLGIGFGILSLGVICSKLSTFWTEIMKSKIMEVLDLNELKLLFKLLGISYVCEFASNLCKDAGYLSIANQVVVFGKCSIVFVGIPVFFDLINLIYSLFAG